MKESEMKHNVSTGHKGTYCNEYVCVSVFVCVRVHSRISKTTSPNFTNFWCLLPTAVAQVLLWRRYDILCTSGFADDVMSSHDRLCDTSRVFLSGKGTV